MLHLDVQCGTDITTQLRNIMFCCLHHNGAPLLFQNKRYQQHDIKFLSIVKKCVKRDNLLTYYVCKCIASVYMFILIYAAFSSCCYYLITILSLRKCMILFKLTLISYRFYQPTVCLP
jgi:hypothetical protein